MFCYSSPKYSHLCKGVNQADSWAVDGHKLLQVPYDSGYAIINNREAHMRAMSTTASYLNEAVEDGRNPTLYVPSRRTRGFTLWAVRQTLGRNGVARLVDDNCKNACQLAKCLEAVQGIHIKHEVHLNQLAITFENNDLTLATIHKLQNTQRWFIKEAEWKGLVIMRVSFSSMPNSREEIDILAKAIIKAYQEAMADMRMKKHQPSCMATIAT